MVIDVISSSVRYDHADTALGWMERVLGFTGAIGWRDATGKPCLADIHAALATVRVSNSNGASEAGWQWGPDPAHASEVEVLFIETSPAQTLVELEYRHLDRHGVEDQKARSTLDNGNVSHPYLRRFVGLIRGT